ncbi:hypothetical protein DPMN_125737 [Dreissena polymorpha]|uniref:Uncharacterized protein n=1 Tax=Dreissena polymorpha TaxID=45954 RepID=A0A9D4JXB9_DREPO|nr:hypothetical protein DPMN_125737 [Dreissena polymorpha]
MICRASQFSSSHLPVLSAGPPSSHPATYLCDLQGLPVLVQPPTFVICRASQFTSSHLPV